MGNSSIFMECFLHSSLTKLAYLMNRNTTASVRSVFDRLEKRLDTYTFLSMFEYILTDYAEEKTMPKFFMYCLKILIQSIEGYMNYYTIKRVQRNLGILTPMEYHDMKLLEAA